MPRIEVAESIDRPVEEVWAFLTEPAAQPQWQAGTTGYEVLTEEGMQKGAHVRETVRFLGRSLEFVYEIVEFEPPRRLRYRTLSGPFQVEVGITLEPGEDTTHLAYEAEGEAGLGGAFGKLVDPVIAGAFRRETQSDLRRLKDLLEARAEEEVS